MSMKLLASVLVCAFTTASFAADLPSRKQAAVPAASVGIDAFASIGIGYNWGSLSQVDANGLSLSGRATFAAPIAGLIAFQADGVVDRNAYDIALLGTSVKLVRTSGDVAGHLFMRNSSGLIGAIGQAGASEYNTGIMSDRRYFLGLEGQYFLGNTTLYGQAVYQNANVGVPIGSTLGISADGVSLLGQIRHFLTPNAMVALKGGYESIETGTIESLGKLRHTAWMVGAKGEYRFEASPVSAFLDVDYRQGKFNVVNSKETETRAMVGVKYSFGSTTLFDRDRSGASLDPIRSLRAIVPFASMPSSPN